MILKCCSMILKCCVHDFERLFNVRVLSWGNFLLIGFSIFFLMPECRLCEDLDALGFQRLRRGHLEGREYEQACPFFCVCISGLVLIIIGWD